MSADDEVEYVKSWGEVINTLDSLLGRVSKELSQPDPWLLLNEGKVLVDNIPSEGASVERFDDEELIRVRTLLEKVREFLISETQPTKDQLKLVLC